MLEYPPGEVTSEKWVAEVDKDNKLGAKKGQGQGEEASLHQKQG
jgi:hypothetical protein